MIRSIHAAIVILSLVLAPVLAKAQVRMTREEALKATFSGSVVERKTAFLTDEEVRSIQSEARAKVESKVLTYYVARDGKKLAGVSFFETSVIRSMPATYMVTVDPDSTIRSVEILAFYEPDDYEPPDRWLRQFDGKNASDDLFLKRGIQNISGATLTAQTLSDAARRLLASYIHVVAPKEMR